MAATAAAALAAASGASAQIPFFGDMTNGLYVAGDIGLHRADLETTSSAFLGRELNYGIDDDWAGFARIGYRFNENIRFELEGGWRPGEIESVRGQANAVPAGLCTPGVRRTAANPTCGPVQGEVNATTLMLNALFDFDFDFGVFGQSIVPFIGAGIGAAEVHNKVMGQLGLVPPGQEPYQNLEVDDTERALAYQGIIGVAWALTPNLSLDLTGRYLRTNDFEFGTVTRNASAPAEGGTGITNLGFLEGNYEDTSVTLGLRYTFAAPPPPPPPVVVVPEPVPVPEPAPLPPVETVQPPVQTPQPREFIVYFPFDQSILTPEAQTVVQEAASYAQQGNATRISVVGHADTSGSAAYNVRLSERRARAVADAMVGLGVNPGIITADWRGESQPAVATGDGVKEPLNRRATIDIGF
ncbi:MAG TPA: OmpA family protein [Caulobacteraceae bacterium]